MLLALPSSLALCRHSTVSLPPELSRLYQSWVTQALHVMNPFKYVLHVQSKIVLHYGKRFGNLPTSLGTGCCAAQLGSLAPPAMLSQHVTVESLTV